MSVGTSQRYKTCVWGQVRDRYKKFVISVIAIILQIGKFHFSSDLKQKQ